MGRAFLSSNSDSLTLGSGVVTDNPATFSVWFEADNITANHPLLGVNDGASGNNYLAAWATGAVSGDPVYAEHRGAGGAFPTAQSSAYVANEWTLNTAVFRGDADFSAFKNGGAEANDTTTISAITGINATAIGKGSGATPLLDGTLGPVSVWDSALTNAQVASLGAGRDPRTMATLPIMHMPMTGGIQDVIGGLAFTDTNGTTEGSHKPLGWN